MILLEKLREQGWYLTEQGLKKLITINNLQTEDVNKIISLALDWDLRDIASGVLPSKPDNNGTIPGRIVLQLQKMRNISAPKANEECATAPRFLLLELCDGVNTIAALEFERIADLNLNVPPGTKLFVKTEKLKLLNGFVVLKASDIQILGGRVEALIEKWELARQMLKYARSNRRLSGSSGPPPWIAFGKRLDAHKDAMPTDRNFKSLQITNEKDKNSKENDEFIASRSQAIAEAAKAGQKKVFGGGQQNILDHNVKKILEKGYSEEEAKQALRATNNNLERALYNLKRRNYVRISTLDDSTKSVSASIGGRIKEKGAIALAKGEGTASKPQTNVSLFDFLTDKLPATSSNTVKQTEAVVTNTNSEKKSKDINSIKTHNTKPSNTNGNRFENNMSSSFAANRTTSTTISEDRQFIQSRSNTFNRKQEECNQQSGNKSGKGGERNILSKTKPQTQSYNKLQKQMPPPHDDMNLTGSNTNAKRNENPFKKEREQSQRQLNGDYQFNKRSNDYNKITEKKAYQSREINRNNQDLRNTNSNSQQKHTQKSNNLEKDIDALVESTSKLSIPNKKDLSSNTQVSRGRNQQKPSGNTKNQKPAPIPRQKSENCPNNLHQQHTSQFTDTQNLSSKSFQHNMKMATYSPQLGNGFAYDPTKIVGFQSKEANEYAMNMLKSQGMTIQQLQQQQTSSPQIQHAASLPSPSSQQHSQTHMLSNQTSATVAYLTQNPNIFVAPLQSAQFGMMSGENWPWKEGDLCLAKYWDDGNYYKAKITAVSEKTCVVLYLDYGNYEEVLKYDCVPITEAQHMPINAQASIIGPSISQPSPPAFQQRSNLQSGIGGVVGNQRYRGERQMYVPPPKRNN